MFGLTVFCTFVEGVEKCANDTSQVSTRPDRGPSPGFQYFSQDPALGGIALLCAEPYIHSLVIFVIPCPDCCLLAIVRAICCHSLRVKGNVTSKYRILSCRVVLIHFCCSLSQAGLPGELQCWRVLCHDMCALLSGLLLRYLLFLKQTER